MAATTKKSDNAFMDDLKQGGSMSRLAVFWAAISRLLMIDKLFLADMKRVAFYLLIFCNLPFNKPLQRAANFCLMGP
ncbi:hypothetical protein ABE530_00455 [Brucella sp. TWI559]